MASIEYSLFRTRFIKPFQLSIFQNDITPRDLFISALTERKSSTLRKGYVWHIGNTQYFSQYRGYFAIGRTTTSTIEQYDEQSGNFIDQELINSPYTHCVFDAAIGFIGIAQKTALSQSSKTVASRLEELLSLADVIKRNEVSIEIAPIPDPEDFIRTLNGAYRVMRFSATFHGPNPFDADEHFQKPLSVYLSKANGQKGRTLIQGDNLNREVLQSVARSTAATGNEASARIVRRRSERPTTVNLKGDPVKRRYAEDEQNHEGILEDLTILYRRVRDDRNSQD